MANPGTTDPGMTDSGTADPGTAELQLGIAMANLVMADPGTAELQLGIAMADVEAPKAPARHSESRPPEPNRGHHALVTPSIPSRR